MHASFVFEGRINRPLEKKSLGVQKHEDFFNFPSILLRCSCPQDKETGMPPQTAERLRTMAFLFHHQPQGLQSWLDSSLTPLKFKMIGTFPKRDQNLQSLGLAETKATPWTQWT